MKKKIIFTASAVHFVLWAIFLVVSVVKRNVFINSIPPYIGRDEMRELIPIRSAYILLIIIAIFGIINALIICIIENIIEITKANPIIL